MSGAAVPPIGPDDHVSGRGPGAILYADLGCPGCAASWERIRRLPLRLCVRHFPVAANHPRAPALHAAAEAAGLQGGFWEMCDSLFADRGRVDDPHLWERAQRFGLDLQRFRSDSRSDQVAARVRRDLEGGIAAGIGGTPAAFAAGRLISAGVEQELAALAGEG